MTQQQPKKAEDPTNDQASSLQTIKEMDVDLGYAEEAMSGEQTAHDGPADEGDFILTLSEVVEEEEDHAPSNDLAATQAAQAAAQNVAATPNESAASMQQGYESPQETQSPPPAQPATQPPQPPATAKEDKGANPFLPKHIIDKLDQGRKDLEDDILQSSAALDVSTALLRTHARAEQMSSTRTNNNPFAAKDRVSQQKQKLVDEIVEEYLPLLASEMRRRLHKMLDDQ